MLLLQLHETQAHENGSNQSETAGTAHLNETPRISLSWGTSQARACNLTIDQEAGPSGNSNTQGEDSPQDGADGHAGWLEPNFLQNQGDEDNCKEGHHTGDNGQSLSGHEVTLALGITASDTQAIDTGNVQIVGGDRGGPAARRIGVDGR